MEPTRPLRRESTAVMAANIGRELREIRAALAHSRGDLVAEPRITAAALAHLLLCSLRWSGFFGQPPSLTSEAGHRP